MAGAESVALGGGVGVVGIGVFGMGPFGMGVLGMGPGTRPLVFPPGIGSSFIGAMSDLYGRKPVLVVSLLLAALGYGLTGYAVMIESFPMFALARLLTGICDMFSM